MTDIFELPQIVFWSNKFKNFMIYTPASLYMFGTLEGSNGMKLCVSEKVMNGEFELEYVGEL